MHTNIVKFIFFVPLILCIHAESFKECKNTADGTFVAVENNCLGYIYCMGDDSYTDLCPTDTYFDAEQQQCAIDDGLHCNRLATPLTETMVQQNEVTQTHPTISSTRTTVGANTGTQLVSTTAPSKRPQCKPTADEYFAYPQRCEYYYRCSRGYLSILRCSFGYGWDFQQNKCLPLKEVQCYRAARRRLY
ncbi:unnamed protein product [Ceratitis capitata]|uniref:(Mediterranean fruit fly) hypothetical protein n=1 Tax=Ceratitis capitata TaxID=7213 RepID=A0A811V3N6_CERCA|nr:unnamed protein product [Ceratitis capitata]